MPLPQISMEGRLVDDPELRYTQSGKAVVNIRVVSNRSVKNEQTNQWEDKDATFLTCTAWDQMAENIAESLRKGLLVTLSGRLRQRDYDDKDGNKHTVYEINLDAIGPSLRWDRAQIAKRPTRDNPSPGAAPAASPWDTMPQAPAPAGSVPPGPPQQPPQQGPMPGWGGQPPQQQPQYDNPPF
jgi:single-strand DNA-binding protein